MLNVGCLLKDTAIVDAVVDYILSAVSEGDARSVKAKALYGQLREDGIEMDFESFAYAYSIARNLADPTGDFMTLDDALENEASAEIDDIVEKLSEPPPAVRPIGKLSPEKQILFNILSLFNSTIKTPAAKTAMRTLQDVVKKKALSLLDANSLRALPAKPTLEQILKEIEDNQNIAFVKEDGSFNNVETLIAAVKEEIENIKADVPAGLLADFEIFTNSIENGLTKLVLSNSQMRQIVKDALIRNGFSKQSGGVEVVDWNKVIDGVTVVTDAAGNRSFEQIEHTFDTMKDAIVNSLVKAGIDPGLADEIAEDLRENIENKIVEKKAKKLKLPTSAVQKLFKFGKFKKDNEGKEGDINIAEGNYLIELNNILNIDPNVHDKIAPSAIAELINLMNDLNSILDTSDPQKVAVQTMSPTVENLFKRRVSKILMEHELKPELVQTVARVMEGFMSSKGLLLANPYNTVQNITGGLIQTLTSGAFRNTNWADFWANFKSVFSGGVENIGKTNAAREEIDLTQSMTMLANYKGKNPFLLVGRLAKAISDAFLNSWDAAWSSAVMNHYALTTIKDVAYNKLIKSGMTEAQALNEINTLVAAYEDSIDARVGQRLFKSHTYDVKKGMEDAYDIMEAGIAAGKTIEEINDDIITALGDTRSVHNITQALWIMQKMGSDPRKEKNMARRLFYEVSRGSLLNDFDLTDKAGIISRVSNDLALTLSGKKTNSESYLSFGPKALEGGVSFIREQLEKRKEEGNFGYGSIFIDFFIRNIMLFAAGAARWGVIGLNYLPTAALEQVHRTGTKDAKSLFKKATSDEYRKMVEKALSEDTEARMASSLASFHKKRQLVNSAILGSVISGILITLMVVADDDDELKNEIINETPGFGKQKSKIIQQFPAVYAAAMVNKYGASAGLGRAFWDIFVSRFPSSNEKNRDITRALDKATKDDTIEALKKKSELSNVTMASDFFTIPLPEFINTWRDYLNGIGVPIEKSQRKPKPDDVIEAWFYRGTMRPVLDVFGAFEPTSKQRKELRATEKYIKKKQEGK